MLDKGLWISPDIIDGAPDAYAAINKDGTIVMFNALARKIAGCEKHDVIGRNLEVLLPSRYKQIYYNFLSHFFSLPVTDKVITYRRRIYGLRKTGDEIIVEVNITGIETHNGRIAVGRVTDLSEEIKSKKKLAESEEQYRKLVEGSHEFIQSVGPDGKLLFVNDAWKKILGYTDDDIKHLNVFDVIAEESREHCMQEFERLKRGETVKDTELVFIAKNGNRVYADGNSHPRFEKGKMVSTQGFFRDISEKKYAHIELEKSKATIGALFQSSNIGYLFMDTTFNILSFNNIMRDWVIYETGNELRQGVKYPDLLDGDRRSRAQSAFERSLTGQRIEYEAPGDNFEGKPLLWFYISINPVIHSDNQIIGVSVTCIDITERKQAELELQQIANEIIQRNKDLEQFAYIVSHNLRSPLSNIMGAANVMQYEDITENDKQRLLQGIYTSTKKLDDVVLDLNKILQVSRNISENRQNVILSTMVDDIKVSINHLIEAEKAQIVTDFTEGNMLFTLKSYLHSIFINLISNSIKYRKPNEIPVINIKSRQTGKKFEIAFSDNGLGIDTDRYKDRIFGLYKRFHETAEGKGLGLFMVKTQVEALGGKITVESVVNIGTTFTIVFEH